MQIYRHYADYLIKRAMSDLGSMDNFLRHVLFTDSLWRSKLLGQDKDIRSLEGLFQREDLNKAIKQETLDGGILFYNARVIIEGENSISVEDIYQLLRQEAAVLEPGEKRLPLIAVIISLADSYIHRVDQGSYPFLEVTNILGPKTFIGFASINLYLIDSGFYEKYFENLFQSWTQGKVEDILNRSFSSLLLSYWVRRLWLEKDRSGQVKDRLEALKRFLDNIWQTARYSSIFYETFVLFRQELPDLADYFDQGGVKMKSFVDSMPKAAREIYEEVLVTPVIKEYGEKLKQVELERVIERERERAERERAEWAEREREHERAEKELIATCQQVVLNKFPDIPAKLLLAINQMNFSKCNQLLRELGTVSDVQGFEAILEKLSKL